MKSHYQIIIVICINSVLVYGELGRSIPNILPDYPASSLINSELDINANPLSPAEVSFKFTDLVSLSDKKIRIGQAVSINPIPVFSTYTAADYARKYSTRFLSRISLSAFKSTAPVKSPTKLPPVTAPVTVNASVIVTFPSGISRAVEPFAPVIVSFAEASSHSNLSPATSL